MYDQTKDVNDDDNDDDLFAHLIMINIDNVGL